MRTSKHIAQLAGNIHFRPDEKTDERILAEAEAALSKRTFPDTKPEKMRIIIMRNPIIRIAAAAVVVVTCLIGLSLWRGTESGIALADVLARVEQVKTFRCKGSFEMTGQIAPGKPYKFETRSDFAMSQEYGYRLSNETTDPNGGMMSLGEFYVSPQKKTFIQIAHTAKKYIRAGLDDAEAAQYRKQLGRYNNPGALLKDIMACRYENLGRSLIEGVNVEGFRTTDPDYRSPLRGPGFKDPQIDVKVWVDVKTHLPIQYEDLTNGIDQNGNKISQRFLLYDFEWDIPVTSSEFEPPPVPDGYAVLDNPPGLHNEETAIQGLKHCVELLGNYLETIDDGAGAVGTILSAFEKSETSAALRLKEEIKGLTEQEKHSRVTDVGKPILRLIWFYVGLLQEKKNPVYYGKSVTPKDADKVLLRWKLSDNEYRIIYGDLHTETVSAEKLAELEKVVSK